MRSKYANIAGMKNLIDNNLTLQRTLKNSLSRAGFGLKV